MQIKHVLNTNVLPNVTYEILFIIITYIKKISLGFFLSFLWHEIVYK